MWRVWCRGTEHALTHLFHLLCEVRVKLNIDLSCKPKQIVLQLTNRYMSRNSRDRDAPIWAGTSTSTHLLTMRLSSIETSPTVYEWGELYREINELLTHRSVQRLC